MTIDDYIYHNGDADTFIKFDTDEINIEAGGENMIFIVEGAGGVQADKVTINNDSADVDFQVKGAGDTNLLRTDAANDKVGIGAGPGLDYKLTVSGTVGINNYLYHNGDEDTYLKFEGNEVNLVAGSKSLIRLDYNNNSATTR